MNEITKSFIEWDLSTWSNILGILGFMFSLGAFIIGLFIKSQIKKLRSDYLFDNRVTSHIKNLQSSATEINQLLNDYDSNRELIKAQFSICISELQDVTGKISFTQAYKCRVVTAFMIKRNKKPFIPKKRASSPIIHYVNNLFMSAFQTTDDDVWKVYRGLLEITRQLENIKLNRKKSL